MPSSPFRILTAAVIAAGLAAVPAQAQTGAEDREAVERIVRDYLLANPEIVEEALMALRDKREQEAAARQVQVIETSRELIFNSDHQAVLGNPEGAITLVEFFDYNCAYCKRALTDMMALIEANPDLRFVMKEFPILSPGSVEAARISVAVKDAAPEKYLEFHHELMSRPGEANGQKALEVARDLGLDAAALTEAGNRPEVTQNLEEVQQLANMLSISGTPSYVIGTELVPGAAGYDALQAKVTAMRDCGETSC